MATKANRNELKGVDGPSKAAMIMMALNEDQAAKLFAMMTDEEIKGITQAMAELGSIKGSTVRGAVRRVRRSNVGNRLFRRFFR